MKTIQIYLLVIFSLISQVAMAQADAGIKIMPKQGDLYHAVKELNNPYKLPLWGQKLGQKGFLLPYPIGIMLNGYAGSQDVTISDLSVGINDKDGNEVIPTTSLDNVVGFSDVKASIRNFNMRADLWVLPFLDVYGIFGKAWVETQVGIGSILEQPVDIHTKANFDGYVYGMGAMLTGGVRSIFFSLDFNRVWTHFDEMASDNIAMNVSLRTGYIFHFDNQPERNISVWTGAGRVYLNNETKGTIPLSEVAPDLGDEYQTSTWYQQMTPTEQALTDRVVQNFEDKHQGDVINYSLEKRPTKDWCMILGTQFQLDRHWQLRVESNFFGGRQSGLISANYRFGIW